MFQSSTNNPNCGSNFLLSGKGLPQGYGRHDFDVQKSGSHGKFTIKTENEGFYLWLAPGSHQYVHLIQNEKGRISIYLEMDEIKIPSQSIFIDNWYVE